MPTKIEKLTKKQEELMPVWRDKWIEIGLRTGVTDWDTFEKYIQVCYTKAKIKFPNKIVRVQSPIVGAFASSIADKIISKKITSGIKTYGAVRGAVRDAVDGAVRGAVDDAVGGAVDDAVDGRITWHYWFGGQFWVGTYWYGSPSMVSFFTDVCGLKMPKDIMERAEAYRKVCESVNYFWTNSEFVMVCARPKYIGRNTQGRLHSDERKAIEYPDGWGLYLLNGIRFPEDLWKKVVSRKMPFQDILAIKDIDQRRQAIKYGNWDEFVKWQEAKKIDEFVKFDKNGQMVNYELWKFPYQQNEEKRLFTKDVCFMRYLCPSVREWHISGVPDCKTVAEAMAWKVSNNEFSITPDQWKNLIPLTDEA